MIVKEPEGVRPRDTYSPVALGVILAICVALLLFIVFFIAAVVIGSYRQCRQRQVHIASKTNKMPHKESCSLRYYNKDIHNG